MYNRVQHLTETEHDLSASLKVMPKAAEAKKGLLSKIDAADYTPGMLINSITNKGITGSYNSETKIPVVLKNKRIAFEFDGNQRFATDFGLPATIGGNSSYSIAAWILNPSLKEIECVLDINEAHPKVHYKRTAPRKDVQITRL